MPRLTKREAASRAGTKETADQDSTTRVCFVIDRALYRELRVASIESDMTVSEVMRQASQEFLRLARAKRKAS